MKLNQKHPQLLVSPRIWPFFGFITVVLLFFVSTAFLCQFNLHLLAVVLINLSLFGFFLNLLYYKNRNSMYYTIGGFIFVGLYAYLLNVLPTSTLNLDVVTSGLILGYIIFLLEFILFEVVDEFIIRKCLGLVLFFECVFFGIFSSIINNFLHLLVENAYIQLACFLLWLVVYGTFIFFVLKKIKTSIKTKTFFRLLFGLKLHKLVVFFESYCGSKKHHLYTYQIFILDVVFLPAFILSLGRTLFLPLFGAYSTYCILIEHNTSFFWFAFFYGALVTFMVKNPDFQREAKAFYGPLVFKAVLWNTVAAFCRACGIVGTTGIGLGTIDYVASAKVCDYMYNRALVNWRIDFQAWNHDRLTTSEEAVGSPPLRPVRADYAHKSLTQLGFNNTSNAFKAWWRGPKNN